MACVAVDEDALFCSLYRRRLGFVRYPVQVYLLLYEHQTDQL